MAHTSIQIQSYLFISQPKVSFQFLISKESSYMVFTSTHTIYFIQSHILRLQMGSTTFKDVQRCSVENHKELSLYKVYGISALLVLNGTSLNSINALLVLSHLYVLYLEIFCHMHIEHLEKKKIMCYI